MLDHFAKDLIATFPLGFVATITPGGHPSLSPKGTFLVLDDKTIAFGEIRSPQTLSHLSINPEVEVNFIDQWKRKGLRVRGSTQTLRRGTAPFEDLVPQWQNQWGDLANRINALVIINVSSASQMTTPPYDDGVSEEEMIALYKAKYVEIYP
ncbi:MAG: pyridoxamine 5'-phosphate oxidase family protein [Pseudoruegeria sp.]